MNDASKNLLHAVESGNKDKIKNALEKLDQVQIADFLLTAKTEERDLIVKEYLQDYPEVLLYLNNDIILAILELLDIEEFAHIIQKLQPEDAVDILEDLDLLQVERLLEFFPKNLGLVIKEILSYPEESAGRLIHKDFIVVPKNWTAEQLLQFIRMQKKLPKYLNEIFVINDRNQPIGSVTLKNVVRAKTRSKIQDVMDPNIKIIKAGQDQEEVAQLFKDYSLNCAAVVDDISQIIGVISIDDVVDVIEEKAEEDILHVGLVIQF